MPPSPCPARVHPPITLGAQPLVSSSKASPSLCWFIRLQQGPVFKTKEALAPKPKKPSSPGPISACSFSAKLVPPPHSPSSLLLLNPLWSACQSPHPQKWLVSESPTIPCSEFDRHYDLLGPTRQPHYAVQWTPKPAPPALTSDLRPHPCRLSQGTSHLSQLFSPGLSSAFHPQSALEVILSVP